MEKTNVMRLLDAAKIPYGSYEYAAPDGALSGVVWPVSWGRKKNGSSIRW